MSNESPTGLSRREALGAAAGTVATVATAGCLGSLVGASSGATEIEPVEPSEPRAGSPGEFYYFLEENGIEVDELLRDSEELYLTYRSEAETVEESNEEIMVVYEVYKRALIRRGSSIEFLYAEISNPFEEQALGWGIDTEWIHRFDSADTGADSSGEGSIADGIEAENGSGGSIDTTGNETSNGSTGGIDMAQITLWNNIMNTKVYEEDLEDGDNETQLEGAGSGDASNANES